MYQPEPAAGKNTAQPTNETSALSAKITRPPVTKRNLVSPNGAVKTQSALASSSSAPSGPSQAEARQLFYKLFAPPRRPARYDDDRSEIAREFGRKCGYTNWTEGDFYKGPTPWRRIADKLHNKSLGIQDGHEAKAKPKFTESHDPEDDPADRGLTNNEKLAKQTEHHTGYLPNAANVPEGDLNDAKHRANRYRYRKVNAAHPITLTEALAKARGLKRGYDREREEAVADDAVFAVTNLPYETRKFALLRKGARRRQTPPAAEHMFNYDHAKRCGELATELRMSVSRVNLPDEVKRPALRGLLRQIRKSYGIAGEIKRRPELNYPISMRAHHKVMAGIVAVAIQELEKIEGQTLP